MPESESHRRAKARAPGKPEVPLPHGGRLDSATKLTATEVQRSEAGLPNAVSRLKRSSRPQKTLQVPQPLMDKAVEEMKRQKVPGTVTNLGRTQRRFVRKRS